MKRLFFCLGLMAATGCTCGSKSLGPLNETAPADLAAKGIIIDQPGAGAPVTGSWVTVSGWLDPAIVATVAIVGAPVDGANTITLVPLAKESFKLEAQTLSLIGSDSATVPATLVIEPAQPEPGKDAKLRAVTSTSGSAKWQWDFDGDGNFDTEADAPTHAWPDAGRYAVTARTKVNDVWVSAFAFVTVGEHHHPACCSREMGGV